jgi:hypothetical protein
MSASASKVQEKTSGPMVKQFSVFLVNRVGALLQIVRLLNENSVDVLAVNAQDSTDSAIIRIVVSDPDKVESLFDLHEVAYSVSEVLVVELQEVETELRRMLQCLLMAEVNILVCFPILIRPHGRAAMVLHLDDHECGWSVLAGEGFRVLSQTDLSR